MALIKIKTSRITEVFVSEEPIADLCVIAFGTTGQSVKVGSSTNQQLVGGVAVGGAALSGKPVRVVTHGIVSGVLTGAIVSAGDRVTSFTSGRITPLNTITPDGAISRVSGLISPVTGTISQVSGLISPVTGTISQVSGLISPVTGTISQVSGSLLLISGAMISGATSGKIGVMGTSLFNPAGELLSGVAGFMGEIPIFTGLAPIFSGAIPAFTGAAPVFSGAIPEFTGAAPVFSGAVPAFTGTAFNTARVLGKALDNALSGLGCRVLVSLGG